MLRECTADDVNRANTIASRNALRHIIFIAYLRILVVAAAAHIQNQRLSLQSVNCIKKLFVAVLNLTHSRVTRIARPSFCPSVVQAKMRRKTKIYENVHNSRSNRTNVIF